MKLIISAKAPKIKTAATTLPQAGHRAISLQKRLEYIGFDEPATGIRDPL